MQLTGKMRRFFAALSCVALLLWPCRTWAVETSASAAIVMDADSGRVLYAHNADARMLIASTTKIMTALVAIEAGGLDETAVVSRRAACTEGSAMYLREGERLTLETLLYGLLLCSGNDAAVAVAEHVGGDQQTFVARMNEKAQALGMKDSSFANPNGLDDPAHYSTARDMAKLACAAAENETLMRIASTRRVTIGGRTMFNHNKLLSRMSGCIGLKTGYTRAAGRTLVSCAQRNGQRLVAVTLRDGMDWTDHQALLDYGFSSFPAKAGAVIGQPVEEVPVSGGREATVPLTAAERFFWPLAKEETLERKIVLTQPLTAPLSAGTAVGEAVFTVNGKIVGRVQLLCGRDVLPQVPDAACLVKQGLPA